jgi:glycosyltransferase involved in cell wall biosynthesis
MRILCIVDCYLPSTKSSAKLMHDLAVGMRSRGHEVTVAAPDDQLDQPCTVSQDEGVTALRIRTGRIKGANLLTRGINEARLSSVMWKHGKKFFCSRRFDLIVFYSPSIFFGPLVAHLKRLYGCKAFLILRDIFPQWAVDAGVMRKGLVWRYFRHVEMRQYKAADTIGVQSPANLDYFQHHAASYQDKTMLLYNWAPLETPAGSLGLRSKLNLMDKVVLFYGGNMGVAQDMDNIIRLAARMRDDPRAHFLLVGDGSEAPRLRRQVQANSLHNVTIHPAVSQEDYLRLVGEFDVGLISLATSLTTHNVPGKMLTYMVHGLPILASINPGNDLKDIVEHGSAGLVSINGDDDLLTANARKLVNDAQARAEMGRNSRALLESKFSVSAAVDAVLCCAPETMPENSEVSNL